MAIVVGHEPSPFIQGALAYQSSFAQTRAERKRREEEERQRRKALFAQQAFGGIENLGVGYFKGKEKEADYQRTLNRDRLQHQQDLTEQQNYADLREFGLPTQEVDRIGQQQGLDPNGVRGKLRFDLSQKKYEQISQQTQDENDYEWAHTPSQLSEISTLDNAAQEIMSTDQYTDDQKATALSGIAQKKSSIRKIKIPRRNPKPTTVDDLFNSGRVRFDEANNAYIAVDEKGNAKFQLIKKDQQQGLSTEEYSKIFMKARADVENGDGSESMSDEQKDSVAERRVQSILKGYGRAMGSEPQPEVEAPPAPPGQGEQGPPSVEAAVQQQFMQLVTEFGDNSRDWPPEAKQQAKPAAQFMEISLKAKYPSGFPENATPEEAAEVLRQIKLIKGILGG